MKHFAALILLLLSSQSFAQKEANNWYFGIFAGIQFQADGSVIPLADGAISTNEGCSSISDEDGNLLFYTDGRNVWDQNHILMPNGNYNAGTGLLGDPSSTQSGIIVPKKDDPNIYYIFTVDEPHHQNAAVFPNVFGGPYIEPNGEFFPPDADDGLNNGLNYSIVDLSVIGTNGSIGDVTTRNVHLVTYNPAITQEASLKCSEKVTAVKNNDGTGYWVITHFVDKFYAFSITAAGVNTTPVVSQLAPTVPLSGYRRNAIGCIRVSPKGNKLAIAHMQRGTVAGEVATNGTAFLYNFNNTTGIVSTPVELTTNTRPYGLEFSPSGNKLYVSYDDIGLMQYNVLSNNVPASGAFIGGSNSGSLQLGPNGRIYRAVLSSQFLDEITNPEEDGALCGFVPNAVTLAPGTTCVFGLPPFITSYFSALIIATNTCHGTATQFEVDVNDDFDSILWDFGDGTPTSTEESPTHTYQNPGTYHVTATITRGENEFNIFKNVTITAVPVIGTANDLTECDPENDAVEIFDLTQNDLAIIGGQNPANYNVFYFISQADADANEQALPAAGYTNQINPQTIYARLESAENPACFTTTSFKITALPTPIMETEDEAMVCANTREYITIDAGTDNPDYTYLWFNGATTPTTRVNMPGIYTVVVRNAVGCEKTRAIAVMPSDVAIITDIDIVDPADNNTVTVHVVPTGNVNTTYLYSLDMPDGPYQESNVFEYVTPGIHTVYVYDINGCGVVSQDIAVLGIPKFFTPNGDGINDTWDIIGMNTLFHQNSSIYIYDRYGKLITGVDPKGKGWDGMYNGAPLPSTDYWYVVVLEDGRTVKGHFSMIR